MTHLTPQFSSAVEYARELFARDTRKATGAPYLSHLLAVAAIVLEHGGSEEAAIACVLHDAAEDHGGRARLDEIRRRFGSAVADVVATCSDSLEPEGAPKAPWWNRKVAYLAALTRADSTSALVAAADKLHNARTLRADYRTLGPQLWARFNAEAGRGGTLWYYRRVAEVLPHRLSSRASTLGVELAEAVGAIVSAVAAREADSSQLDRDYETAVDRERSMRSELGLNAD
jgi:(p)ppGpp synthase/HD superfamily hydrolase